MRRPPRRRREQGAPERKGPRVNDLIRAPRVLVIDQEGNKLTIEFEKAGEKRVLDSFVTLAD